MAATYRISATPSLFTEGEYRGKLRGVTFTAVSAADTREWFTRNCGQFPKVFSQIMTPDMAREIVASLTRGDAVEFHGHYQEHQFARGFMFEWSPVYPVAPPSLAYGA